MSGAAGGAAVEVALGGVIEPAAPRDGDCLTVAAQVTEALRGSGFVAEQVQVTGWVTMGGGASIVFLHSATLVGGDTIVDFTARQFHGAEDVPARWIAPVAEYCTVLAQASGVERVGFGWS